MANITQRGDHYKIIVCVGRDSAGKKIQKTTTFTPTQTTPAKIRKEVEDFARDFEKKIRDGKYIDGDSITFAEFEKIWLNNWATQHLTVRVREDYVRDIERRAMKTFGHKKIGKISPLEIQSIIDNMTLKDNLSPKSVRNAFISINSVFRYAYKLMIIQENPCSRCELPKNKKDKSLHYFTKDQATVFLNALDMEYHSTHKSHNRTLKSTGEEYSVPEYTETHRFGKMWKAFFYLSLYGAFRRGEICALKWSDIDEEEQTVKISRAMTKTEHQGQFEKSPKTVAGNRETVLPSVCFQILNEWKKEQQEVCFKMGSLWEGKRGINYNDNYIFTRDNGLPIDVDTPTHKFREILDIYNNTVEDEKDRLPLIRLHDLRHTSATLLLAENVDIKTVSKRLGHEKTSTTLDIYGHALQSMDRKASDTLERLFG